MRALDDYITNDFQVVNISLLVKTSDNDPVHEIVKKCIENRICIVVAAGNKGPNENTLNPIAKIKNVISVGAIDDSGMLLNNSSRGIRGRFGPTVVANGCSNLPKKLINTKPIYNERPYSTSFAAPKVTRCVSAIIIMIRILENIIHSVTNATLKPVQLPVIGIPDTGGEIDFELYPPYVKEMVEKKLFELNLLPNEEEKKWMKKALDYIIEYIRPLIFITDRPYFIKMMVEKIADLKENQEIHEFGAGKIEIEDVISFFSNFSLLDLIWFFNHSDTKFIELQNSNPQVINQSKVMGKLFNSHAVREICLIANNVIFYPSKIVA